MRRKVRRIPFDCPHCHQSLKPVFFEGYTLIRVLGCISLGLALATLSGLAVAWYMGFHDSTRARYAVFVIVFCWFSMPDLWDRIVCRFFLPRVLTPADSNIQVLGLSQYASVGHHQPQ